MIISRFLSLIRSNAYNNCLLVLNLVLNSTIFNYESLRANYEETTMNHVYETMMKPDIAISVFIFQPKLNLFYSTLLCASVCFLSHVLCLCIQFTCVRIHDNDIDDVYKLKNPVVLLHQCNGMYIMYVQFTLRDLRY